MKKRIVAGILVAMMAIAAVGCGKTTDGNAAKGGAEYTIGIAQFAEHGSLDNCREGFIQGLANEGFVEGENLTIDYQNAQINLNSAQENAKGQKIEVYISQQEDLTDDQRQRIRNRAALLQTAPIELDTEKSSFKKDLQNIFKDAEENPIFGYYDTWEDIYKKVFGVENLPSAFKKEDGSVDNEAIRNALATEAATKQIGILNDNLNELINGKNGIPGLRDQDPKMADRLERLASGSLTQEDIDWFNNQDNKDSTVMKQIAEK